MKETPLGNEAKKYDFFSFHANQIPFDKIHDATQGGEITMLPEDQSYKKYAGEGGMLQGIPQDQFHEQYQQATTAYNGYKQAEFEVNSANSWQGEKPLQDSDIILGHPAGMDKYGRVISTPSEVGAGRGYYVDDTKGGEKMISRTAAKWSIVVVETICVVATFFDTLANEGIKAAIGMAIVIGAIVGVAGYAGLRMFWPKEEK